MKPIHAHLILLIISFVVTASVITAYFYMYNTVGQSVNRAVSAARTAKVTQVSSLQQKSTVEQYNNTQEDRARLVTFFINENDAVHFIETLENIGHQSGTVVTISGVGADDINAKSTTAAQVKGHVDAVGSWPNVMRALELAENLPYQSKISGVRLALVSSDPKKGNSWQVSYDVSATLMKSVSIKNK